MQVAPQIIDSALKAFGRIDGIVVNHGVLAPITRISESSAEEWRHAYDINVFSAVALVSLSTSYHRKHSTLELTISSSKKPSLSFENRRAE